MCKSLYNLYLYPKVLSSENPYINDLENAISPFYNVVNKEPNNIGVLNIFKYLFGTKIFYLNWIENIPVRKFGKIQYVAFLIFLYISRKMNKLIIWTLHNKMSHETKNLPLTNSLYRIMFRYADIIITHSRTGIAYAKKYFPDYAWKISYIVHPVKHIFSPPNHPNWDYDLIIWGTIWPYKGIVEFLEFIYNNDKYQRYKILIVGQCVDELYKVKIKKYLTNNIVFLDEFFELNKIAQFVSKSRFVLFTYLPESILSSASLMDSIGMGSFVIGPDVGAFNDLKDLNFVYTYHSYDEVFQILETVEINSKDVSKEIMEFCRQNVWKEVGIKLDNIISAKLKM